MLNREGSVRKFFIIHGYPAQSVVMAPRSCFSVVSTLYHYMMISMIESWQELAHPIDILPNKSGMCMILGSWHLYIHHASWPCGIRISSKIFLQKIRNLFHCGTGGLELANAAWSKPWCCFPCIGCIDTFGNYWVVIFKQIYLVWNRWWCMYPTSWKMIQSDSLS